MKDNIFYVYLLASFLAILSSAYFSIMERLLGAMNLHRIRRMFQEEESKSWLGQVSLKNPVAILLTIQTGRLFSNITFSILMMIAFFTRQAITFWAILKIVLVILILIFICNVIIPLIVSLRADHSKLHKYTFLLRPAYFVLYPFTYVATKVLKLIPEVKTLEDDELRQEIAEQEIQSMIDLGQERGIFEEEDSELLESMVDFVDTTVKEVMMPRTDMVTVNVNWTLEEIITLINQKTHSRYPVVDGSLDQIVGILYIKDLFKLWGDRGDAKIISKIMRKPFFVPETKKVKDLLREFQKNKIHMAIIVDEYGGTMGLVTIEDLLEEIVGEIQDEFDEELDKEVIKLDDGSFLVKARMRIDDLEELLGIEIPREDFETVGGFIFHQMEHIPSENESFTFAGYNFCVLEADEKRIITVKITPQKGENKLEKVENSGNLKECGVEDEEREEE